MYGINSNYNLNFGNRAVASRKILVKNGSKKKLSQTAEKHTEFLKGIINKINFQISDLQERKNNLVVIHKRYQCIEKKLDKLKEYRLMLKNDIEKTQITGKANIGYTNGYMQAFAEELEFIDSYL